MQLYPLALSLSASGLPPTRRVVLALCSLLLCPSLVISVCLCLSMSASVSLCLPLSLCLPPHLSGLLPVSPLPLPSCDRRVANFTDPLATASSSSTAMHSRCKLNSFNLFPQCSCHQSWLFQKHNCIRRLFFTASNTTTL